jgi:hypothetical protein
MGRCGTLYSIDGGTAFKKPAGIDRLKNTTNKPLMKGGV